MPREVKRRRRGPIPCLDVLGYATPKSTKAPTQRAARPSSQAAPLLSTQRAPLPSSQPAPLPSTQRAPLPSGAGVVFDFDEEDNHAQ